MRAKRAFILIAMAAIALGACGSSDTPVFYADFYVNPVIGNDNWDGSFPQPFKTITKAMAVAAFGNIVRAEPGTYEAPDETFPIRISNGVTLVGDEAARGEGPIPTVIEGMGSFNASGDEAAVVTGENSTIAGFLVRTTDTATVDTGAVYINATGVTVRNNTLMDSFWGLFSDNGPNTVMVQDNIIKSNTYGVDLRHTGMDLGGGAAGSTGGNHFICSSNNDIYFGLSSGTAADARSNYWDHRPPTEGLLATDDIYNKYGHTLDITGFTLSLYACP
jgi:nitrous oxidase accessory protein NosD